MISTGVLIHDFLEGRGMGCGVLVHTNEVPNPGLRGEVGWGM